MAHIVAAPNETTLPYPRHTSISKVQFSPDLGTRYLVASGWDGTVRIFNVGDLGQHDEKRFYFHGKPVLACAFVGSHSVTSGGVDKTVKLVDIETGTENTMGHHTDTVRCLEYNRKGGVIVSGSWDNTVKIWDARARSDASAALQTATLSDKVFAMDVLNDLVVVGTKDRKIYLYDMRNLASPISTRDSPLKYQTRSVAFFPSADAFVVSSIEARVAVEYVNMDPEEQKKKYAFKCHRNKETDGTETIYAVNALAFHPKFSTFASGGGDGLVSIWDPFNRKRLVQLHKYPSSIVSLSFSADGNHLAIASSYCYDREVDPVPIPDNVITIRQVSSVECHPK